MKTIIEFLRTLLFTKPRPTTGHIWIYVRCARCGEALKAQINPQNDLSVVYAQNAREDRYHTHKTIIGSNLCFQRIEVDLEFDAQKRIIATNIEGGTMIDEEQYNTSRNSP